MGNEAEAPAPSLPRIGEHIAGKYQIDRILATGGMGVVVSAKHVDLNQRVAIKFLLPEMLDREELVARFLREAKAMVGLHGEHAVKVYDVGTLDTGSPYMVMELLRGNDLDEELEVRGPLEVDEGIHYFLQACEAIAEAHRIGIVHRDIKPSNLFLARRPDGSRIVKVLDFGISKLLADEAQREHDNKLTTTTAMLGSPQYMSPEQVRSAKDVDGRSDIWSLGCVLYEMLANVPPFAAQTVSAVSAMIVADEPPSLQLLRGDVPPGLNDVVMRCLAKDRVKRFQTVAGLAEALSPFAASRSHNAIERVVRISRAPRYESSFPPPIGGADDVPTRAGQRLDESPTTISDVAVRNGALGFRESEATLSATSTASRAGDRAQNRRNGLLIAAAALLGAISVWLLVGSAPEPEPSPGSALLPAPALEAHDRKAEQHAALPEPHRARAPSSDEAPEVSKPGPKLKPTEPEPESTAVSAPHPPSPRATTPRPKAKSKKKQPKPVAPPPRQHAVGAPTPQPLVPTNDPLGSRH